MENKLEKPKKKSPWVIIILALIVVALIVTGGFLYNKFSGTGNHRYRELMNSADRSIKEKNYEQAQNYLNQALTLNTKDTQLAQWLLESVINKQRENEKIYRDSLQIEKMREDLKEDFSKLQEELNGSALLDEKKEQCRSFLKMYEQIPSNAEIDGMISEIKKSLADLEKEIQMAIDKEKQYQEYIKKVNKYLEEGNYTIAAEYLQIARQDKNTPEINRLARQIETKKREYERNGTQAYNAIKDVIDREKYLAFKAKYPGSIHLPDMKKRFKAADQALPPEKYWDRSIKKNQKGHYELLFGSEQNGHLMIYIPGRNFWIDKYEVSNLQYRNFLKAVYRKSSTQLGDDENPAVVDYEEAESYCKKYGFRLPTEAEWEYAASGGKNIDYPWGNESPDEKGIWRANYDSFDDEYKLTAPVKSFEKFSSPFGVVNMAGNVWEWIQGKILKGGSFFSEIGDLKIKKSIGEKNAPPATKGFRCLKQETGD